MPEPILPARAVTWLVYLPARRALTRSFQHRPKGRNFFPQHRRCVHLKVREKVPRPGISPRRELPPPPGCETDCRLGDCRPWETLRI